MTSRGRDRRRHRRQRAEERRALTRGRRAVLQHAARTRRDARALLRTRAIDDRDEAREKLADHCGKGRGGDRWVVREVYVRRSIIGIDWPRGSLVAAKTFWLVVRGFRAEHVDPQEIPW